MIIRKEYPKYYFGETDNRITHVVDVNDPYNIFSLCAKRYLIHTPPYLQNDYFYQAMLYREQTPKAFEYMDRLFSILENPFISKLKFKENFCQEHSFKEILSAVDYYFQFYSTNLSIYQSIYDYEILDLWNFDKELDCDIKEYFRSWNYDLVKKWGLISDRELFLKYQKEFKKQFMPIVTKDNPLSGIIYFNGIMDYFKKDIIPMWEDGYPIKVADYFKDPHKCKENYKLFKSVIFENSFKETQLAKNLSFEDDNFIIVVPTSYKDLVLEGKALHNCLAGYEWDTFLKKGQRSVVFVRSKEKPQKSYVACDIDNRDGSIRQFLTFNNNPPKGEDIKNFERKYANYLYSLFENSES